MGAQMYFRVTQGKGWCGKMSGCPGYNHFLYMEMLKILVKGFCCSANLKTIALSRYHQHRFRSSVSRRQFVEILMTWALNGLTFRAEVRGKHGRKGAAGRAGEITDVDRLCNSRVPCI